MYQHTLGLLAIYNQLLLFAERREGGYNSLESNKRWCKQHYIISKRKTEQGQRSQGKLKALGGVSIMCIQVLLQMGVHLVEKQGKQFRRRTISLFNPNISTKRTMLLLSHYNYTVTVYIHISNNSNERLRYTQCVS